MKFLIQNLEFSYATNFLTTRCMLFLFLVFVFLIADVSAAGQKVKISPDLEIYYEEKGSGQPIVFIPGWIGTTEFMKAQVEHFSNTHRAVTFDPRSQGESSKTLTGNTYRQHGVDLNDFLSALELRNVVLVGHSWGCLDAYSYFDQFGTENVRAVVCIDSPPKTIIENDGDWGYYSKITELKPWYEGLAYNLDETLRGFLQAMVTRPVTEEERQWFVGELAKTPMHAMLVLDYDGNMADYSNVVRDIDGKIPVLNVVGDPGWWEGWTDTAKQWLGKNAPNSKFSAYGLHLMHWEFPDRFNAEMTEFLKDANVFK